MDITIINDNGVILIPIIEASLSRIYVDFCSTYESLLNTSFTVEVSFFNPMSNRWEPLVEEIGLGVTYLSIDGGLGGGGQGIVCNKLYLKLLDERQT